MTDPYRGVEPWSSIPVSRRDHEWIVKEVVRGRRLEDIECDLVDRGVEIEVARRAIRLAASHPYATALHQLHQRLEKLESVLDVVHHITSPPNWIDVPVESGLSPSAFYELYYRANRPVVLRHLVDGWAALDKWTPEWLRDTYGDHLVALQSGRTDTRRYELDHDTLTIELPLREVVTRMLRDSPSNDIYIDAANGLLDRAPFAPLHEHIPPPRGFFRPHCSPGDAGLWFGPAGTVSPLHHDAVNVLLVQVHGRKRVLLVPPIYSHRVYNTEGVFCEVDAEQPDLDRHPDFAEVPRHQALLQPGDALFLPVAWWHHVRALDISLSVSLRSFVFPNAPPWKRSHVVARQAT